MWWSNKLSLDSKVEFPAPLESVQIRKRIYHKYMYCDKCNLEFNESEEYIAKRCIQCGRKLVQKRELAAFYDNENKCYNFKYINLDNKQIKRRRK
jgi:predicted RNA-binding Zn-ribbon protein involved in translation (DUF1610 family)